MSEACYPAPTGKGLVVRARFWTYVHRRRILRQTIREAGAGNVGGSARVPRWGTEQPRGGCSASRPCLARGDHEASMPGGKSHQNVRFVDLERPLWGSVKRQVGVAR